MAEGRRVLTARWPRTLAALVSRDAKGGTGRAPGIPEGAGCRVGAVVEKGGAQMSIWQGSVRHQGADHHRKDMR